MAPCSINCFWHVCLRKLQILSITKNPTLAQMDSFFTRSIAGFVCPLGDNDPYFFRGEMELMIFGSIRRGELDLFRCSLQTAFVQSEDCNVFGPSLKT